MSKNTSQSEPLDKAPGVIKVEIFSPTNSTSLNVHWIEIDSPTGFFTVGPGHINTLSLLKPGGQLMYESEDNYQGTLTVPGGMAIIQNNVVKLMLFTSNIKNEEI